MPECGAKFEVQFRKNLTRYSSRREQIKRRVDRILTNPYFNKERLSNYPQSVNLLGCRSARVDRNFRIIFVICEECLQIVECDYCFCEGLDEQTVIFLTVGPHERAYDMH